MKKEIGIVTIEYNKQGGVINSNFESTLNLRMSTDKLEKSLKSTKDLKDLTKIVNVAQIVFSNWFNLMTKIELGDDFVITHDLKHCEKYDDTDLVKKCVIAFGYDNFEGAAN